MKNNFAENLKRIRTEKNITQGELGKKIGVHPNHISRYERGDSSPSAEILKAFADALNISIDELVVGDRKGQTINSIQDIELIKLVKKIEVLTDEEKETVKDLISAFIFRNETKSRLSI